MSIVTPGRHLLLGCLASLGALGACGDDAAQPDAAIEDARVDAPPDAPADAGPCGADQFVTGELVDLDSTGSAFLGVANATFTVQGQATSDATSPNGRFELCAPAVDPLLLDVDAPGDRLDGPAYLEADALTSDTLLSFRSMTAARAASFYVERGLVFDPTRAHVLVFLAGDQSEVDFDRAHDAPQAASVAPGGELGWSAGRVGRYVLFPNVEVTGGATGALTGDFAGPHTIPLAAGELTLVAVHWLFL